MNNGKIDTPDGIIAISADQVLMNTLNAVYLIIGIIAVAMIVYAGITYVRSAGDSKNIEKAKNTIIYAVVGLVIILLAAAITNFIIKGVS